MLGFIPFICLLVTVAASNEYNIREDNNEPRSRVTRQNLDLGFLDPLNVTSLLGDSNISPDSDVIDSDINLDSTISGGSNIDLGIELPGSGIIDSVTNLLPGINFTSSVSLGDQKINLPNIGSDLIEANINLDPSISTNGPKINLPSIGSGVLDLDNNLDASVTTSEDPKVDQPNGDLGHIDSDINLGTSGTTLLEDPEIDRPNVGSGLLDLDTNLDASVTISEDPKVDRPNGDLGPIDSDINLSIGTTLLEDPILDRPSVGSGFLDLGASLTISENPKVDHPNGDSGFIDSNINIGASGTTLLEDPKIDHIGSGLTGSDSSVITILEEPKIEIPNISSGSGSNDTNNFLQPNVDPVELDIIKPPKVIIGSGSYDTSDENSNLRPLGPNIELPNVTPGWSIFDPNPNVQPNTNFILDPLDPNINLPNVTTGDGIFIPNNTLILDPVDLNNNLSVVPPKGGLFNASHISILNPTGPIIDLPIIKPGWGPFDPNASSGTVTSRPGNFGITSSVTSYPGNSGVTSSVTSYPDNSGDTSSVTSHPGNSGVTSSVTSHPGNSGVTSSVTSYPGHPGITSTVTSRPGVVVGGNSGLTARPNRTLTPIPQPNPVLSPSSLLSFICETEIGYYGIEETCDSYLECRDFKSRQLVCPDGLVFNRYKKYPDFPCSFPTEVDYCNVIRKSSDSSSICPNLYGYFAAPDNECSRYFMCEEGRAIEMFCPHGLVFNERLSACDWPANVPQCNPAAFDGFRCPDPGPHEHEFNYFITKFRYRDECTTYIACERGFPRFLSCPGGLVFHQAEQACVPPARVPECGGNLFLDDILDGPGFNRNL